MYDCDVCGKSLTTMHGLKLHKRTHTGEKPFQCDVCQKAFICKRSLSRHFMTHTKERPFVCDFCGRGFPARSNLKIHIRTHTQERPYACDLCDAAFVTNGGLRFHKKTHLDVKEFVCEVCKKGFHRKSVLQTHMNMHTGHKPYVCKVCNEGFKYDCVLRYHMAKHIVSDPVKCQTCFKEFRNEIYLKDHVRRVHGKKSTKERIRLRKIAVFFTNKLRNKRNGRREDADEPMSQSDVSSENLFSNYQCNDEPGISAASSVDEDSNYFDVADELFSDKEGHPTNSVLLQAPNPALNTVIIVPQDQLKDFIEKFNAQQTNSVKREAAKSSNLLNSRNVVKSKKEIQIAENDQTNSRLDFQMQDIFAHAYNEQIGANITVDSQELDLKNLQGEVSMSDILKPQSAVEQVTQPREASIGLDANEQNPSSDVSDAETVSVCELFNEGDSLLAKTSGSEPVDFYPDVPTEEMTFQWLKEEMLESESSHSGDSQCSDNALSDSEYNAVDRLEESVQLLSDTDIPHDNQNPKPLLTGQIMAIDAQSDELECLVCNKRLSSKSKLSKHLCMHFGSKAVACKLCDKRFTAPYKLKRHMYRHTGNKPHKCSLCPKSFIARCHLEYHFRIHTGERPYECHICKKRFMKKGVLKVHMAIHSTDKPHVCKVCQKSFKYSSGLSAHMKTEHTVKEHVCRVCAETFETGHDLKKHSFIHGEDRPYECAHCSWSFRHRWALERHKLLHSIKFRTGFRRKSCEHCGEVHSKNHSCKGEFVCDLCGKVFDLKVTLDEHLDFHASRNPFFCYPCKASFIDSEALKEHQIITHGIGLKEEENSLEFDC